MPNTLQFTETVHTGDKGYPVEREIQHPNPPCGFYSHKHTTVCDVEMDSSEIAYKIEKFIDTIGIYSVQTGRDTAHHKPITVFEIDVFFRYNRIRSTIYVTVGRDDKMSTVHYYLKSGERYTGTKLFYVMINRSGISALPIPRLLMSYPRNKFIDDCVDADVSNDLCKNIVDMLLEPFADQVYCGVSHIMSSYHSSPHISYAPYIHIIVDVLSRFSSDQNIIPITAMLVSKILHDKDVGEYLLRKAVTSLIQIAKSANTDSICARVCLDALCTLIYKIPVTAEMLDMRDVADAVFFSGPCAVNVARSRYLTGVAARLASNFNDPNIIETVGISRSTCSRMRRVLADERVRLEDLDNERVRLEDLDNSCIKYNLVCVAKLELYITEMIIANREGAAREPCVKLSRHACELRDMIALS